MKPVFERRYPVPLNELLLAPLVFRESVRELGRLPAPSLRGLRLLAEHAGHRDGAIRTALSRLRAAGMLITEPPTRDGVTGYALGPMARSIAQTVRARAGRPEGWVLAVFAFETGAARERHVVREALRLHGFVMLAKNVYVTGAIDTSELEELVARERMTEHVFLFRGEPRGEAMVRRLRTLLEDGGRAEALLAFERDLEAYLEAPGLDEDERARRILHAGPTHYRITFLEEPPVPRSVLSPSYPLPRVEAALGRHITRRRAALRAYFERLHR